MPQCPVDGCSAQFGSEASVIAHVQGSGGDHRGYSYMDAKGALDDGRTLPAKADQSGSDLEAEAEASAEATQSENPLVAGPEVPRASTQRSATASGPSCPACGGALTACDAGVAFTGEVDGEAVEAVTEDGDHYCESCLCVVAASGQVIR